MIKQMFAAIHALALVCGSSSVFADQAPPQEFSSENPQILGSWSGVLELGALRLTLTFDIAAGSTAQFSCLEHGISDLPADVSWHDGAVTFKIAQLAASFEGLLNEENTEIAGNFLQHGGSFPLTLTKGEKTVFAPLARPQEPKPPYPYQEEIVKYPTPNADVSLAGTLTLPRSEKPCPAVILIAGSGPMDRNETIFGHSPLWVLADHLTRQGIAVLRADKRGIGASTGNFGLATTEDFFQDVLAGIAYLKTRKEIDSQKIGLIGHSEGGIIAPMVAANSKDVAFIVMLAGPAVKGQQIMCEQIAAVSRSLGMSQDVIEEQLSFQKKLFSIIKKEPDLAAAEKKLHALIEKYVEALPDDQKESVAGAFQMEIKQLNTNWFRYFLTYDPAPTLEQVTVPVLALNGTLDLQVSPKQNLPVIAESLSGNKDHTIIELPHLNHLFQTCETGTLSEYATIEETFAPSALSIISAWILERTAQSQ